MNEAAFVKIQSSLSGALETWLEQEIAEAHWEPVGYVGHNFAHYLTLAVMAVIRANADTNKYFEEEKQEGRDE